MSLKVQETQNSGSNQRISVFTELLNKTHLVFHHRERSRKISMWASYIISREADEDVRQEVKMGKKLLLTSARLDDRNCIICLPFDQILD